MPNACLYTCLYVAQAVPRDWSTPPSSASVRHFLKEVLPPYAVPSTYCILDALPGAITNMP